MNCESVIQLSERRVLRILSSHAELRAVCLLMNLIFDRVRDHSKRQSPQFIIRNYY